MNVLRALGLVVVPLAALACGGADEDGLSPVPQDAGATTSTSTSTTTGTSTGGSGGATTSAGGSGGSGGTTTSTTSTSAGGSGGTTTSTSAGGAGGSGGIGSGGTGGSGGTASGGGGAGDSGGSGGSGGAGAKPVRIAAANLSTGNLQSWDPGHGIRILQGVHADIVLMQEMNYGNDSPVAIRNLVEQVCGPTCEYARGAGAIPNGVVSRFPILASGSWVDPKVDNRDFTWAKLDVPGPIDLWAVSVHLLTSSESNRDAEAKAIVGLLAANVPAGDYVVVGGDFNTDTRDELALGTFAPVLVTGAPWPVDGAGNGNTNGTRKKPHDWVLPSPTLSSRGVDVVIGATSYPDGLVVDTRVFTPLTDLAPAQLNDSGAPSMQHMAVVRDFALE